MKSLGVPHDGAFTVAVSGGASGGSGARVEDLWVSALWGPRLLLGLRWLKSRLCSRGGSVVFALVWFGSWLKSRLWFGSVVFALVWFGSWLKSRLWFGSVVFALVWFGSWLLLNGLVLVHTKITSDFCSDEHSKEILNNLCQDFLSGLVSGELCLDLCVLNLVRFRRCLHYRNGKKVLEVRWRDRTVILKSKHENFSNYEGLPALQDQVRSSLGLTVDDEDDDESPGLSNSSLWKVWNQSQDHNRSYSRADLSSLWALLQQEEYTFLRLLQDLSPHVPRVLSSCGHFYAVEFLSAGQSWDQHLFSSPLLLEPPPPPPPAPPHRGGGGGGRDHRIALSFLDLVWRFDHDFRHKLHLCDVKAENFGIREDLTVVALDVDMAFFEPRLQAVLEQNCSCDEDCSFFDCWSHCDLTTLRCSPYRSNSNLQAVCEKIFRPWFSPSLLGAEARRPLQVELQRAVQECSETHSDQDHRPGLDRRPGRRNVHRRLVHQRLVHRRLVHALTRLVEEGGASDDSGGGAWEEGHAHTALNF